jgi:hypothetical protein
MAEIFAAVASGAGLVSLAIQLLESSQKLKGLYNASKSAPKTASDLCFELETLSLQEASKTYGWFIREHVGEQIFGTVRWQTQHEC